MSELQAFRNEKIPNDSKELWIIEFENLGINPAEAVKRIEKARYTENYGKTKFSQFIDTELDELVPDDLVYKKAVEILESRNEKLDKVCVLLRGKEFAKLTQAETKRLKEILNEDELYSNHIQYLKDKIQEATQLGDELRKLQADNETLKTNITTKPAK